MMRLLAGSVVDFLENLFFSHRFCDNVFLSVLKAGD